VFLSYCTEEKVREADGEKRREAQRSAEMLLSAAFRVVLVYTRVKLKQRFAAICTYKYKENNTMSERGRGGQF
jgi:hypothetical protein